LNLHRRNSDNKAVTGETGVWNRCIGKGMQNREDIQLELLILKCRNGDRRAFGELVGLLEQRLYFFVRRLVRSEEDAWDILQQTWVDVFRGVRSLRDTSRALPWLYRIARNKAADHMRDQYRHDAVSLDEVDDNIADTGDDEEWESMDPGEVRMALETLSPPHREVLTLHFLEDFSIDEIADITGAPSGTVKSRLHYAKRALGKAMKRGWLSR